MLSLLKHSLVADGSNPILKEFTIGRQAASAGPEMVWKIFDATRNIDNKVGQCYYKFIRQRTCKPDAGVNIYSFSISPSFCLCFHAYMVCIYVLACLNPSPNRDTFPCASLFPFHTGL